MPNPRIGLFGGTFDPPHIGHLILASEARSQLRLDLLLWMLTPTPPHKLRQKITSLEQRREMLERAIAGEPAFELSMLEAERPGPHYTLDTVRLVAERFPGADLVLLIGGDSLRELPTWHKPAELLAACKLIGVMQRPYNPPDLPSLERQIPGIGKKLRFVQAPLLEIASSEIRKRARNGKPYKYYLREAVFEYIMREGLYGERG